MDLSSVVSFLLSFIPGGDFYNKILDRFLAAKKTYEEKKHLADEYLKVFEKQRGGLYEKDGYTELIRETVKWIQEDHGTNHKAKKTVLIIEDLDRLDPQHLFRILNVLSAHIDDTSNPDKVCNKFGFDNIVLVMDYETTEYIFHHFYGANANYQGYMSKFLACEPFRYSFRSYLEQDLISQLKRNFSINEMYPYMINLQDKISSLSMRDITRLCNFDTQDRIKKEYIEICGQEWGVSTSFPLFHLILFMIECGVSIDKIIKDLSYKREYDCSEYASLLFPLFYMMKKPLYIFNGPLNDFYQVDSRKNQDGILVEIDVSRAYGTHVGSLVNIAEQDTITPLKSIFEGAFNHYIDFSSVKIDKI